MSINILFLMAGSDRSGVKDNNYPLSLVEVNGVPLIELQIKKASSVEGSRLIFALKDEDVRKYHLNNIISLIRPDAEFISVNNQTKGAACTALLAVKHINNDNPLIILNVDEFLRVDYSEVVNFFENNNFDAGTIVFNSVHPRYSFVKLDEKDIVIEAAEKNPISRHATAGFYYFKKGSFFIEAAQNMIKKDASTDGSFFICPVFNEMTLSLLKVGALRIENHQYLPIKSEVQMTHFMTVMEKDLPNESE